MPAKDKEPKKQIREYDADILKPKMVYVDEDEVFNAEIAVQCPEGGEVAVHFANTANPSGPYASAYMTPTQAHLLAERIKTAAWIADNIDAPDED